MIYKYIILLSIGLQLAVAAITTNKESCRNKPNGHSFRHKSDCGKYWVCNQNVAILMNCPRDLWFDENLKVCNYKDAVDCSTADPETPTQKPTVRPTEKPTVTTTPAIDPSTTPPVEPTVTSTKNPTERPNIGKPEDRDYDNCKGKPTGFSFRHRRECNLFWVCVAEIPHFKTCPTGLWFDNNRKICDYKENVNCVQ